LAKTQLIYSVSCFNFRGLGALFWGLILQKPPRGNGTGLLPRLGCAQLNFVNVLGRFGACTQSFYITIRAKLIFFVDVDLLCSPQLPLWLKWLWLFFR